MSTGAAKGSADGRASGRDFDVLVLGSGIGGMESALKLGDMGYKVLVVEKEASVGGRMVLLSKVFPTLDCASCISTPKMAATAHHPNVTVFTYSEVDAVHPEGDGHFRVQLRRKPRFVDESACTGCRQCEGVCQVSVPDQFNDDLVARRAAHIPFPQAVPQKALIERAGSSPCSFACPAGIKAHGYVALARGGEYEKAFELILEATPLIGSLGRACYAPCESECTRGSLEGPVPIRRIKRFVADRHYASGAASAHVAAEAQGKKVAIVGSGPAGLTAAWQLALKGYGVKIFEAAPEPGGMLRYAIPAYRLPAEVVERDIQNVTDLGVEIETSARVDGLEKLRSSFDAVLVATGTPVAARLGVPGEELNSIADSLDFLRRIRTGDTPDLSGQTIAVIGGGNVAIDVARSALRLGAAKVHLACLESRAEMPAHEWEVEDAISEGVELHDSWGIGGFTGESAVTAVELKRCTAVFDAEGRFNPAYDETITEALACDEAIVAIGMGADTDSFAAQLSARGRKIAADPHTLETGLAGVFAAGDAVSGPSIITQAVGQGQRAAFMIDRFLQGLDLESAAFDDRLPAVEKEDVLRRQKTHSPREPLAARVEISARPSDFSELEPALSEDEVRAATARCLDCGVCSECHECISVCPADAIDFDMREQKLELEVGAVVVSTGYKLFPADLKPQYGFGKLKNVITGTQMERLLAPTRPYNTLLRPGDGKMPERIGYVMCTGSRDETVGNPLCSKFCCMYSIKQNQLIMGVLPLAELTVHYIDVRAVGKGYEEFFQQASAMGAEFKKGRVAEIRETEEGNVVLRYEDVENGGGAVEAEYDLVVLAVGVQPNRDTQALFPGGELAFDEFDYIAETDEDLNPALTSAPGVYVAGAASGAKDIPESILHAGAAAAQVAAHLERLKVKP
ncbi:MAG: FAD-dependent oxidoreductase [Gaiellaceae bacterium]